MLDVQSEAVIFQNHLRFKHPCSICIYGCSDSGKTSLILKIIKNKDTVFDGKFKNFYWCLPAEAAVPSAILAHDPPFKIVRGPPNKSNIDDDSLIIVDDLGRHLQVPQFVDFLTVHSHHSRCTIIYVLHQLFPKGPFAREIALNTKYTIFLKQPRCPASFLHYATQALGKGGAASLYRCYLEENKNPYSYFICDCTQSCPPALRFRTRIFPDDEAATIFATPDDVNALVQELGSQYGGITETE